MPFSESRQRFLCGHRQLVQGAFQHLDAQRESLRLNPAVLSVGYHLTTE